jgi:hypothetical protein
MAGSKTRVENESPPEGPYIIRTGFHFDDEQAGRRLAVVTCSDDQNGGSWLEDESTIEHRRSLTCRLNNKQWPSPHKKTHPVISLREAVEWGVLDVFEGCVLISNDALLSTLATRIAS